MSLLPRLLGVGRRLSKYGEQTYGRLITRAEELARVNGGQLPYDYARILAQEGFGEPKSVSWALSRLRSNAANSAIGNPDLRARVESLGRAEYRSSDVRALMGRLMDQGLKPAAILERVNAFRQSAGMGPSTRNSVKVTLSQIRAARRRGDTRYAVPVGLLGGGLLERMLSERESAG